MQIALLNLTVPLTGPGTADVRTPLGRVTLRWHGPRDAAPGTHHVEWTVDEPLAWGRNAGPAAGPGPALHTADRTATLRGRLHLTPDGAAVLELASTQILLDVTAPPPAAAAGTWIDLTVALDHIGLSPYTL